MNLPRRGYKLRHGSADKGREYPCAEDEERAEDEIVKILFRFGELALVAARGDEHESGDDDEERDDGERDHHEHFQRSRDKIWY